MGAAVGTWIGGPPGTVIGGGIGFGVAWAGWHGLSMLQKEGLDLEIDQQRSPEMLKTALAELGIKLEWKFNDRGYLDPERGLRIGDKPYSKAQFMAAYVSRLPKEQRRKISGLGIRRIIVPRNSAFNPQLFVTVMVAVEKFRLANPNTRDIVVKIEEVGSRAQYTRYGNQHGEHIVYDVSIRTIEDCRHHQVSAAGGTAHFYPFIRAQSKFVTSVSYSGDEGTMMHTAQLSPWKDPTAKVAVASKD